MTHNSKITATINCPLDAVHEALSSRGYWEYEAQNLGDEAGTVKSFTSEPTVEVVLSEVLPSSAIPEAVRGMVNRTLEVTRTVTFAERSGETVPGTVSAEVSGAPVQFSATTQLSGEGETTLLTADSAVTVRIPMMGGMLEPKITEWLKSFLADEARLIEKYIVEQGA